MIPNVKQNPIIIFIHPSLLSKKPSSLAIMIIHINFVLFLIAPSKRNENVKMYRAHASIAKVRLSKKSLYAVIVVMWENPPGNVIPKKIRKYSDISQFLYVSFKLLIRFTIVIWITPPMIPSIDVMKHPKRSEMQQQQHLESMMLSWLRYLLKYLRCSPKNA